MTSRTTPRNFGLGNLPPPPNGYPSTRHFVEYCVRVPLVSCACNASTNEVQIRARGHEIPFREPSHTSKYWRAGYNIGEMSDQKQKGKKIHINPSSIVQVHTVYRYPWVAVGESLNTHVPQCKKNRCQVQPDTAVIRNRSQV